MFYFTIANPFAPRNKSHFEEWPSQPFPSQQCKKFVWDMFCMKNRHLCQCLSFEELDCIYKYKSEGKTDMNQMVRKVKDLEIDYSWTLTKYSGSKLKRALILAYWLTNTLLQSPSHIPFISFFWWDFISIWKLQTFLPQETEVVITLSIRSGPHSHFRSTVPILEELGEPGESSTVPKTNLLWWDLEM